MKAEQIVGLLGLVLLVVAGGMVGVDEDAADCGFWCKVGKFFSQRVVAGKAA